MRQATLCLGLFAILCSTALPQGAPKAEVGRVVRKEVRHGAYMQLDAELQRRKE